MYYLCAVRVNRIFYIRSDKGLGLVLVGNDLGVLERDEVGFFLEEWF